MCTMFGSLDQRVFHRPLEEHSHETGRDGPQELQQNTSISRVFVLGALVPAMLLATWWVRPPSMTGGVGNPTTAVKRAFSLVTFTLALIFGTLFSPPWLSRLRWWNALQSITNNDFFRWTCHHLRSAFRTTMRIKGNFLLLCFHVDNLRVHVDTSWRDDARGVVMRSQAVRDFTILARV